LNTILHSVQKQMLDLLEGWLRHKSDMVNLEVARVICDMKGVTPAQVSKAISGNDVLHELI
jgi:coatomer protein complex subunit gamma